MSSSYSAEHGTNPLSILLLLLLSPALPYAGAQTDSSNPGDRLAYTRFTPSMAIIIAILIVALFFMGFFSIYIRRCSDNTGGTVRAAGAGQGRSRRGARGLDPAVIETFPTLVYSAVKGLKIGKGALECAVCLSEFEDDEKLRLLPKCDHAFHPECIDEWLASHTTCPVCRANLALQPDESAHQPAELTSDSDIEAQNDVGTSATEDQNRAGEVELPPAAEPDVINVNQTLNRNRTRRSRSSRPHKFPRSHSTGHSLVHPGENTDRFTLRLPVEVREQIMKRQLNRARSMVVLPREGSSRRGYRSGGEGSGRGRYQRRLDRVFKSDRWLLPFFTRTTSLRSPRVAANDNEMTNSPAGGAGPSAGDVARPPV